MKMERSLNILVILTDQQKRATLGTYGNPIVRTPHIDRFAGSATVFENAVCAMPVTMGYAIYWTAMWDTFWTNLRR